MAYEPDPRWEWHDITTFGGAETWLKGQCRHTRIEPVHSVAGDHVADLCLTCDTQLPAKDHQ